MGLFPFFTDEDDENMELEDPIESMGDDTVDELYKEYEIDLTTGQLTGRIVEGTDALKVWAILVLKSERYKHSIYSWNYGEEFSSMIGESYDPEYLQSEVKRMVEECLLVNEHITSIIDLEVEQKNDHLYIRFTMETDQGDMGVETNV